MKIAPSNYYCRSFSPFFLSVTILAGLLVGGSLAVEDTTDPQQFDPDEYIEPWTKVTRGLFKPEDCKKIIDEAVRIGFPTYIDSIDYSDNPKLPSLNLDVIDHGEGVKIPSIHKLYEPYLPIVNKIVQESKIELSGDTSPPSLDWVFVRKYAADIDRNSLSSHNDVNLFTVNIALNDDYEGGGLLYIRPQRKHMMEGNPIPEFDSEESLVTGASLADIARRNSSRLVFPEMHTGDVFMHNYTVFHAVAPVQKGERYTLIFFYDMDHPVLDEVKEKEINVELNNEFEETVNLAYFNRELPDEPMNIVGEDIEDKYDFQASTDDIFHIISQKTGKTLQVLELPSELDEDNLRIWVGPGGKPMFEGVENFDDEEDNDEEDDDDDDEEKILSNVDLVDEDEDDEHDENNREFLFDMTLVNHYEDVDLYRVFNYNDLQYDGSWKRGLARMLITRKMGKQERISCRPGDVFEVVRQKTSQVLERIVIPREHDDGEIEIGGVAVDEADNNAYEQEEEDKQEESDGDIK